MSTTKIMIIRKATLGIVLATGAVGFGGCAVRTGVVYEDSGPGAEVVYADQEPPPPQVEVVGVAPGPDFVWIGGSWSWNGRAYVWVGGRWEHGPHPGAVWVDGRWNHGSRGWHHEAGHWR